MKLTVDQALQKIHREYEGDSDYLEFDDEETDLRVEYLKDGIREWADRFPEYREQFYSLSDVATGDKTTDGTSKIDTPDNFIRPAGTIKIGDSVYLSYIEPSEIDKLNQENSSAYWYTVVGYPGAFDIKYNPVQATGLAINYDFWGTPVMPDDTLDVIPISRPLFAVHYTLWKLFSEDDPERAREHKEAMDEQERRERVALAKSPGGRNTLLNHGAGFGDRSGSVSDIVNDR